MGGVGVWVCVWGGRVITIAVRQIPGNGLSHQVCPVPSLCVCVFVCVCTRARG